MEQPKEARPPRLRFSSTSFLIGFGIGSFVGVAFAILAIAMVQDTEPAASADTIVHPPFSPSDHTPLPTAVSAARPRTVTQLDVRLGPGPAFAVVGILQRGEAVDIVGRDATGEWVAVRFPPGSAARGWVPVSELDGVPALESVAVVLPTPLPRTISTPPPVPVVPRFDSSGNDGVIVGQTPVAPSSLVSTTPTRVPPRSLPTDLVVNRVTRLDNGRVRVVVGNQGPGVLEDEIVIVVVRDLAANSEQLFITSDLAVGATLTIETRALSFDRETDIQVIIDPGNSTRDPNRSNNVLNATVSPPPSATPTPRPSSND
jgi:hypothetical protein